MTWITDSALFVKYMGNDTLYMHSDTLKIIKDSLQENDIVLAYNKVKIFSSDFKLKCDSLSYQTKDSVFLVYFDPVLWFDSSQVTGTEIRIYTRNEKIDRMFVAGSAFMADQVDDKRFNQIKGRNLTAYFAHDELDRILVEGNAESVYYWMDDDEKYIGKNKIQASTIRIQMKDKKIFDIRFYNEPDGEVQPPKNMDKKEPFLKGFFWRIKEKPGNVLDIFKEEDSLSGDFAD